MGIYPTEHPSEVELRLGLYLAKIIDGNKYFDLISLLALLAY